MRWCTGLRLGACCLLGAAAYVGPASGHVGGLGSVVAQAPVPSWLTVATGGVVVGASFLFTALLTDHEAIRMVNSWRAVLPVPGSVRRVLVWGLRGISVGVLGLVVWTGLFGPPTPTVNFAVLVVWAGWWSGYAMTVYLLGNTWPALNPWRAIASALPGAGRLAYPATLGAWPSVVGLLALVWIEVSSPVGENPRLLAGLVLGYTAATVLGAALFGVGAWFGNVDPLSRVFAAYGRIAPFRRTDGGFAFALPTAALSDRDELATPGEAAFVVALLWTTTYDGLVSTPGWAAVTRPVVGAGVPPVAVYAATLLVGYLAFVGVYRLASRSARSAADTYVDGAFIERWFAPALLPIAAGYHLAHFLGYFLSLAPAVLAVAAYPFDPPASVPVLVVPDWFGVLQVGFVLLGHLLAVWVAHSRAFDLFPGVLKPIRSQYPLIAVMVLYTMTSLWVVVQPYAPPPYR